MSSGTLLIVVVAGILAILSGWLVPVRFKSRRPYGLWGDILASTLSMLITGLAEWLFLLPALGITGWLAIGIAIGDPWGLALLVLWLMRRMKS